MRILSINLENFKCFDHKFLCFTSRVEISGCNGEGKSSISNAIIFCLYGKTSSGGKETDKFIKKGENFCEVTMDTNLGKIKRKRGKQTKIWLDGKEINQWDIEEKLNLPDFDVFNSIFNVGYFMTLDEATQRQIILDLTEGVDMTELFKKLGGGDELIEKYKLDLGDIDGTYKSINKEKLSIKKIIEITNIQLKTHQDELSNIVVEDVKGIESKKEDIQKCIDVNINKISELQEYNSAVDKYESIKPMIAVRGNLEKWLKDNPLKVAPKISSLQEEKSEMLKEFVEIPNELNCPVCHQEIDQKHKEDIEDKNKIITEKVANVDKDIEDVSEIEVYNQKVSFEQNRFNTMDIPNIIEPIKPDINQDIDTLQNENLLSKEKLDEISQSLYKAQSSAIHKEELELSINTYVNESKNFEDKLEELKSLVDIFSPKGLSNEELKLKLQPLKDKLEEEVSGIDIVLLELLKSQMGYKKCFKILVNEIEYKRRSAGERKRIDIAISITLNNLLKEKYNNHIGILFIDERESISSELKNYNSIQLFSAKVTEEELKVQNL